MTNDNTTEQIKSRLNIVDVISEYISLKKTGASHRAPCPFHSEKTPSFHVSEEKQIWHCFGCGVGGDIFEFVMKVEGVEFREALKMLATKAGVALKFVDSKQENKKALYYELNEKAAEFFNHKLKNDSDALKARDYIKKRCINDQSVDTFLIGYSPSGWGDLRDYLIKNGYTEKDILDAGLLVKSQKSGRVFDRFRNRLMFPIQNSYGNVVGFSARVLDPDNDKMGKYINTPQTQIYNKSEVIYGLFQAKSYIKQKKDVVFVEGQIDVISCYQAGINNVVATSGTALTTDHVRFVSRYADTVSLCFDSDNAGKVALLRAVRNILPMGIICKVVELTEGKDPDDLLQKNPDLLRHSIINSQMALDYYIEYISGHWDPNDPLSKKKSVDFLLQMVFLLKSAVMKDHYVEVISSKFGIPETTLKEERQNLKAPKKFNTETEHKERPVIIATKETAITKLGERFLAIIFEKREFLSSVPEDFERYLEIDANIRDLYKMVILYYNGKEIQKANYQELLDCVELIPEQRAFLEKVFLLGEYLYSDFSSDDLKKEFLILQNEITKKYLDSRMQNLQGLIKSAESSGDKNKVELYLQEVGDVSQRLQKFK